MICALIPLLVATAVWAFSIPESMNQYEAWKASEIVRLGEAYGGIANPLSWMEMHGFGFFLSGSVILGAWLTYAFVLINSRNVTLPRRSAWFCSVILLIAFAPVTHTLPMLTQDTPIASCTVDVMVALDEEFSAIRGLVYPFWSGMDWAQYTIGKLQAVYRQFDIEFNVLAYVQYDSDDEVVNAQLMTEELNREVSHEDAMLIGFSDQGMYGYDGFAIPWLHTCLNARGVAGGFQAFPNVTVHEVGHLFNLKHCTADCYLNPIDDHTTFCSMHQEQLAYWKEHWQEIPIPPDCSHGGGAYSTGNACGGALMNTYR